MKQLNIKILFSFTAYLLLQVLVLKQVSLFDMAFCLVYVSFILCLPFETSRIYALLLAFFLGIAIDLFYAYPGLHASALMLLAFVRNYWFNYLMPPIGYESGSVPGVSAYGAIWFLAYAGPLIVLHHTVLFFTEAAGFQHFGHTFMKASLSSIFTLIGVFIIQYLGFHRKGT